VASSVPPGAQYDTTKYVLIPAGTFFMGDTSKYSIPDQRPFHRVRISQSFLLGIVEVSQAMYDSVMGTNPSTFPRGDAYPVENVSWYDAVAFCNALSVREGLTPCYSGSFNQTQCDFTANGYRLPTEAEWEYACRAGTTTDLYTGDIVHDERSPLDEHMDIAGWYIGNWTDGTHPVASKEPNAFGLYDIHGNVYEWCWDWFDEGYYSQSPESDPVGPATGSLRTCRGGSWSTIARYCRSAARGRSYASQRNLEIGFRLARTYPMN
jgi:formylglycine-generating enzyme required for sulfatase activity